MQGRLQGLGSTPLPQAASCISKQFYTVKNNIINKKNHRNRLKIMTWPACPCLWSRPCRSGILLVDSMVVHLSVAEKPDDEYGVHNINYFVINFFLLGLTQTSNDKSSIRTIVRKVIK